MRTYQPKYLAEHPEQKEKSRLRTKRRNQALSIEKKRELQHRYRKTHGNVWLPKELLQAARNLGLVPGNICAKALKEAINQAKNSPKVVRRRGRHKRL